MHGGPPFLAPDGDGRADGALGFVAFGPFNAGNRPDDPGVPARLRHEQPLRLSAERHGGAISQTDADMAQIDATRATRAP